MKPGDMVLLLECLAGSTAYQAGLRAGAIGIIISKSPFPTHGYDWVVDFPTLSGCHSGENQLRLIPPHEPCDADFDWRNIKCPEGEPA